MSARPVCRICGTWRCNVCGGRRQYASRISDLPQTCPTCKSTDGQMYPTRHTSWGAREDHESYADQLGLPHSAPAKG